MIKVNFKAYGSYLTDSLYQWDINQVLEVSGLNLTTAPEVHFSNSNIKRAIDRQASLKNGIVTVTIPNSLLQEPFRISAHIGIYEGDTFKVIEVVEIPVTPRTRPADYQITDADEELYSFKRLENMLANKATTAQVANIVTHNNDTDGNTELIDIRTDRAGKIHASAGEAVREQFGAMLRGIEAESMLLGAIFPGEYADNNTGEIKKMSSYERTDFLDISDLSTLHVEAPATLSFCALYDENKNFIQQITLSTAKTDYNLPEGAAYIVISAANGLLADTVVKTKAWNAARQQEQTVAKVLDIAEQGTEPLKGAYTRGTMLNGVIDPSVIYRATTKDILTYSHDITLKVYDEDYQFGVAFYAGGGFVSQTGWNKHTDEKLIPAGTEFRVVVSPVTAVWEEGDIDLLASKVRIETALSKRVTALKRNAVKKAIFSPKKARFVAHRGLSAEAPENTLAAFEKAGQAGAFAIETDVYSTSDGRFLLAHDDDISAYTDAPAGTKITESTFDAIRAYKVTKGANAAQYEGQNIPTLEEYLEVCNIYGCVPFIEIKNINGQYARLAEKVNSFGYYEDAVYINYAVHHASIRSAVGDCMLTINLEGGGDYVDQVDALKELGAYNIIVAVSPAIAAVDTDLIKKCHEYGYLVNVWTVNDADEAKGFFRMGTDMVTSDSLTSLK